MTELIVLLRQRILTNSRGDILIWDAWSFERLNGITRKRTFTPHSLHEYYTNIKEHI